MHLDDIIKKIPSVENQRIALDEAMYIESLPEPIRDEETQRLIDELVRLFHE